jgi:hypothetical protein
MTAIANGQTTVWVTVGGSTTRNALVLQNKDYETIAIIEVAGTRLVDPKDWHLYNIDHRHGTLRVG